MHEAVVGTGPDGALLFGRLGQSRDRAVVFRAGIVTGDRTARPLLSAGVVPREVGTDRRPRLASVGGTEEYVSGVVDDLGIVGRQGDRGRPSKAIPHVD